MWPDASWCSGQAKVQAWVEICLPLVRPRRPSLHQLQMAPGRREAWLARAVKRSPFLFRYDRRETRGYYGSWHGVPAMCDYSLELVASRPAKVGDKLISTGFKHTVSRGFASVDDRNLAVCLLPGTELVFEDEVRCETGFVFSRSLGQRAATFRQINRRESNRHHDALEFPDGKIVLLTQLCENQIATVLQLPATAPAHLEAAERNPTCVA
jgi:hypothetical protein